MDKLKENYFKMKKICHTTQFPPLYRRGVFIEMERTLDCDFYFGDNKPGNIKKLDVECLKNVKKPLKNINIGRRLFWQKGLISLIFKPYNIYISIGGVENVSLYLFAILLKFIPGKKLYLWGHGCYGRESNLRFMITDFLIWLSNGYFTYGEYAKNLLIKKGIDPRKLEVIYNSLDYDNQRVQRETLVKNPIYKEHFGNENPNLIFIGRLTNSKSLDMLIQTQQQLKARGKEVNVTFIGDGESRSALETLAKELGLEDKIWFYGACHSEDIISKLMYNADICISPGNVGLTAMHALMYGCPVITQNDFRWQCPEFEAIIPNVTGDFFEYKNNDSLTDRVEEWLNENGGQREVIRKNCYSEIDEKWNPKNQVKQILKMINR